MLTKRAFYVNFSHQIHSTKRVILQHDQHVEYLTQNPSGMKVGNVIFFVINALFYPYARFVYEQVISFIMGENVFFINAIVMLMAKVITMCLCWIFSIFIAPVGLAYLYYYHSRGD
ncbi:hypothetical protein GYD59_002107 [Salmonella enterica]|nr:hypothetical protein [Salmonella enterica]